MKQNSSIALIIFILLMFQHPTVFAAEISKTQAIDTLPKSEEKENYDKIFTHVEIEAGPDRKKWIDHLKNKMPTAIEKAVLKNIPVGKYEVVLLLTVEKTGKISKIEIEKDPGYGLAETSIEIVRAGPPWKAGEVCGLRVRTYKKQPLVFVIEE